MNGQSHSADFLLEPEKKEMAMQILQELKNVRQIA